MYYWSRLGPNFLYDSTLEMMKDLSLNETFKWLKLRWDEITNVLHSQFDYFD